MVKVSVIMPAYTTEDFIEEAIQSVQNQTFQDWELLVVDDGSPDNLVEIVTRLKATDNRIQLIRQKNSGVSVARNTGIKKAKGEYISFLDSDDYWDHTFLEKTFRKARSNKLDFVYSGYYKQTPSHKYKIIGPPYIETKLLYARIFEKQSLCMGTFLVEKSFLNKNHLYFSTNTKYGEDIEFVIKIFTLTNLTGAVKEALFYYRYRHSSAQRSGWNKNREDILLIYHQLTRFLTNEYPDPDLPKLLDYLKNISASHLYRLLWGAVSAGEFDVASDLIDRYPNLVQSSTKKWTHTLKLKIVALKNPLIWKVIHLISK